MNASEFISAYLPLAQKLWEVLVPGGEPLPLPMPAALEAEVVAAEHHLRVKLDPMHREFLLHANGWSEFSGTFSLFGTSDLHGSALMDKAQQQLRLISNTALGRYRSKRKQLLPVAVSDGTLGVLCMLIEKGQVQPPLVWFDNTEPDEYPTFDAYMEKQLTTLPASIAYFTNRERRPRAN
ncbi:MAG: SMI1/KNR4 family protein [Rhodoferax sp.]|nr:SMI1/KNR4 family protein [Rhodoferax sp.]